MINVWEYGEYMRLSKNPYYFRRSEGLPNFDQLIIRFSEWTKMLHFQPSRTEDVT